MRSTLSHEHAEVRFSICFWICKGKRQQILPAANTKNESIIYVVSEDAKQQEQLQAQVEIPKSLYCKVLQTANRFMQMRKYVGRLFSPLCTKSTKCEHLGCFPFHHHVVDTKIHPLQYRTSLFSLSFPPPVMLPELRRSTKLPQILPKHLRCSSKTPKHLRKISKIPSERTPRHLMFRVIAVV